MSFTESSEAQPTSPRPDEPDVLVCIHISILRPQELRYVACISAARRFAEHWTQYHRPDLVTFEDPEPTSPRLPCERLWVLP
ncbi:hypothetical protein [Nocardia nova]|uniref:hypothetical protein n=1 Tax=Nocardia nova TaxID=37330 RepID=UPI003408AD17